MIKLWSIGVFTCLSLVLCCHADERPNIIFMFIDDMGYADPSCFGNPHVKTPRIDQLAEEGLKLTNFYVNSPICSPSRVSVTTGQYPSRWKIHSFLESRKNNDERQMADFLPAEAPTTARKLQAAGYATAHFGKWHIGGGRDVDDSPLPQAYGFDESTVAFEGLGNRILDNPKSNSIELGQGEIEICDRWDKTKRYTDLTIDFIKRNKDRPFYVHLFPNDVHDRHVPIPGTEEKWKTVTDNPFEHTFFSVLEQMDEQLGRVIDAVDELGLAEETLIIFTSDNGPTDWAKYYSDGGSPPGFTGPFHGRKWSLYEGGIRMPFIARWKGRIPAGVTDETSIMSGIDLSPTFCQLAGVKAEGLDGVDCGEVLLGKTRTYPKPLFWQYGRPYARLMPGKLAFHSPSYAVRDGDYKFLVNPDGTDAQLFDIASDQGETANLLAEKPDLASGLQQKIGDWSQEVGVEFDASAKLEAPKPKAGVVMFNKIVPFEMVDGDFPKDNDFEFDGKSHLELPRQFAPSAAGQRWLRAEGQFQTQAENGVILSHGDDEEGYSVHIQDGKLTFSHRSAGKAAVAQSEETVNDGKPRTFYSFRHPNGGLMLKLDGKEVGTAKGDGAFLKEPAESIQVGADTAKPVGAYQSPNRFVGRIWNLEVTYKR